MFLVVQIYSFATKKMCKINLAIIVYSKQTEIVINKKSRKTAAFINNVYFFT